MNTHPTCSFRARARGITLVEILIVLSVLVVIASFAIPSIGNATARAEITAATENVRYSVEAARKLARSTESRVVLEVMDIADPTGQAIGFARVRAGANDPTQDYRLPDDVRLVAAPEAVVFDRRGLAENPGQWILVSTVDESITETIMVN